MAESELILNDDGSIYHLNLLPEDIADVIFTVGDPNRVARVSQHFDSIEIIKSKREFITHTGYIGKKRLTVMSTGMGPGNIDIFMNEMDALANIDFSTRTIKESTKSLSFIRLGTSGSLHPDVHPGEVVVGRHAIGLDTVMLFYTENKLTDFEHYLEQHTGVKLSHYWASGSALLDEVIGGTAIRGTTITAPGFYGAQNRSLRLPFHIRLPFDDFHRFKVLGYPITNMEMESSTIYLFAKLLGHHALSVNCILANRLKGTFTKNPKLIVDNMIKDVVQKISDSDQLG